MCNSYSDCPGDEDEVNCCDETEFQCGDQSCIPDRYVCNAYSDCPRGEDEVNCGKSQRNLSKNLSFFDFRLLYIYIYRYIYFVLVFKKKNPSQLFFFSSR